MARLVTKFRYLKPSARRSAGGYARYIATRDGVEKLPKTYADYIALRPRAQRLGSHGLFTDAGVPVQLSKVSAALNAYKGNVYTAIFSLRREDAARLGFDRAERWRGLLRSQAPTLAAGLKIPLAHLRWYAAFHNEGHHPHVHLLAYSENPCEGHLSKQGVATLRSALVKDIFAQELLCIYEEQTQRRDELKQAGRDAAAELVEQVQQGHYKNPAAAQQLAALAVWLKNATGKKQYAYLPPEVKRLVDGILDELAADERLKRLYALWYRSRDKILDIYAEEVHERLPLAENPAFRSMKNAVIQAAMQLVPEGKVQPSKAACRAAAMQLLRSLARLFQQSIAAQEESHVSSDRKLRRRTAEKEQAHGLKHSE